MWNTFTVIDLRSTMERRAEAHFQEQWDKLTRRVNLMFAGLLGFQWLAGIVIAIWWSPRTWAGADSSVHIHVIAAVVLGTVVILPPVLAVWRNPSGQWNKFLIAIAQMLNSALLIHVSGGRIETHFHIFGSLAFLAFYRDWRVFIPATLVVAVDHFVRGYFWPQSVYGVISATAWRSFEHAGWVLFEDAFLIYSCVQSKREMQEIARKQANLEAMNEVVECKVRDRTDALRQSEQLLRERETRIRAILEAANEGIITINGEGIIETFNSAAATMFGYEQHEAIGKGLAMLMPTAVGAQNDGFLAEYLRTGTSDVIGQTTEVEGRRHDGSVFPAQIAVSEVRIGQQRYLTGIVRDLTDQKRMQCELAHAQKLESVGQLAAGIAHEINTPTQYVGDNVRFLSSAFGDLQSALQSYQEFFDEAKEAVDPAASVKLVEALEAAELDFVTEEIPLAIHQALEGVENIARIVRAMKQFSHPGMNDKTLVDLRKAIETTLTVCRNEWKYLAEVHTEFADDVPPVPGLHGELNQVLLNLIVNAAHAIEDKKTDSGSELGLISISTRRIDLHFHTPDRSCR